MRLLELSRELCARAVELAKRALIPFPGFATLLARAELS
jgi:hypothetical protein